MRRRWQRWNEWWSPAAIIWRSLGAAAAVYRRIMRQQLVSVFVALSFAVGSLGCTEDEPLDQPDQWLFGGDRGVELRVPQDYDHNKEHQDH